MPDTFAVLAGGAGRRATESGALATGRERLVRATEAYLSASGVRVPHARVLAEIDAELNRSRALVRAAAQTLLL